MPKKNWLSIAGRWAFDGDTATFAEDLEASPDAKQPAGVALANVRSPGGGRLSADITLPDRLDDEPAGRLLLGYDAATKDYYTVGLGGYGHAYVLHECRGGMHRPLCTLGERSQLLASSTYDVAATIHGQRLTLTVDGIDVFTEVLPRALASAQTGVCADAAGTVKFEDFRWHPEPGKAFVVMEFGEPYDSLYGSVIRPVCQNEGFDAERADDVFRPGVILQDITSALESSDVVIAEISPENANVFYEVGYAHARRTPTILLARRGEQLPFDVSGYRTIFYEDTIGGKDGVAADLGRHLASIR